MLFTSQCGETSLNMIDEGDLPIMVELFNKAVFGCPELNPQPWSLAKEKATFLENNGFFSDKKGRFSVFNKTNELIGIASYTLVESRPIIYEIGRVILPMHQRKGHGTRICKMLASHLFLAKAAFKVISKTSSTNQGAQNSLEKCGFSREGILRKSFFRNGEVVDYYYYGIFRDELKP